MSIGDDYTDDSQGHAASLSLGGDAPEAEAAQQSGIRWLILMLSCFLLFGNYFAYDNPAALNTQLQKHLEIPYDDYQFLLSSLYSIYSLPNTILPFVFGHIVDRFGPHRMLLFLSGCVCVGQALFAFGVQRRTIGWMLIGRGIFGIGGESCGVAQASITTRFFRGHELAFALGLNLCISRFGSVVNTLVTPWVEQKWNVTVAVWIGTLSCILSFVSAVVLISLMQHAERQEYRFLGRASISSSVSDTLEADTSTVASEEGEGLCRMSSTDPIMSPHPSVHSVVFTPGHSKIGRAPSLHIITDQSFLEAPRAATVTTWQEAWWDGIRSFPTAFWLVCMLTVLLYGTVVPFNNIASDFLQSKWFPGNPRKATAIMGIPDTIGSVLVPVLGLLVDKYGGRASVLIMSAAIMVTVHLTLGFTMLNPIFAFALLGVAYSMYGVALWPSIACVVKDEIHLGMGYGISSSFLNISLTLVPPIVATIRVIGDSFIPVEMFFISMGLAGIAVGFMLKSIDAQQGGALEAPEIDVEVPIIVPPPGASPAVIASPDIAVNPLLSPLIKYQSKSLGRTFSDHILSPLGIYQQYVDDTMVDYADRGLENEDGAPLSEPMLSPNENGRHSRSRYKRAYTLPWGHHIQNSPPPPIRPNVLQRMSLHRSRTAAPRSLTSRTGSPLLQQHSARASSSSSVSCFYGSLSTPSMASLGQGIGIVIDEEATLNEPPLRPLPPQHQYSVRQHPILHNPLRGSNGSFRINRNARRIGFGDGEEGNLFFNGLPVVNHEYLQSVLLGDTGSGELAGVEVQGSGTEENVTEEDDPDG